MKVTYSKKYSLVIKYDEVYTLKIFHCHMNEIYDKVVQQMQEHNFTHAEVYDAADSAAKNPIMTIEKD